MVDEPIVRYEQGVVKEAGVWNAEETSLLRSHWHARRGAHHPHFVH
jgi:hypothetical protein